MATCPESDVTTGAPSSPSGDTTASDVPKPLGGEAHRGGDVFAGSQMAMLLLEPGSGAIVEANAAACRFYGYRHEELLGMSLAELAAEPESAVAALRGGELERSSPLVMSHRLADGSRRTVVVHCTPVAMPAGRLLLACVREGGAAPADNQALTRSELTHRIVAENAYDWEYWQSPDGALLYCSPSCQRITGYERAEFLQDPTLLERIVFPDDWPRFRAHRLEECSSGLATMEFRITTKDGAVRWLEHVCQPVYGPDGACLGTRASNRDATARKLMEQERAMLLAELEASRQRAEEGAAYLERERDILRAVTENTTAQLAYLDAHFNFVAVNTAYVEGCGYSREVLIGRNHFELYPNEENQAIFEHVRDSCRPVRFCEKPFAYIDQPERGVTYWDWSLVPVGEQGNVRGLVLSLADVTDRVKARRRIEELAAEAQSRAGTLAAIISSIADGVVVYGPTGEILSLNPGAEALLGYSPEQWALPILNRLEDLSPLTETGEKARVLHYPAVRALRGETVQPEALSLSLRGVRRWVAVSAAPIHDAEGIVLGAVAVMRDVTEERTAQQRLEQRNEDLRLQREQLAALAEELQAHQDELLAVTRDLRAERERLLVTVRSIADGMISSDGQGLVRLMNPVAEALTGWKEEDALGRPLPEVFAVVNESTGEPLLDPLRWAAEGGARPLADRAILTAKSGEQHVVAHRAAPIRDASGNVLGTVLVFRDLTGQRQLEEEVIRRNKLEALERLAAGIAHGFNNLLTAMLGNIVLAKLESSGNREVADILTEAEKAAATAVGLTQQLLTLARAGASVREPLSLSKLLPEAACFALSGSQSRCELLVAKDLWSVNADREQIAQVIGNLVLNAAESMPDGGTVVVAAENVVLEEAEGLPLPAGPYVKIAVTDNGVGIGRDDLAKVFDPYFSTKQKGRGLGLASCNAIVLRHEGHIAVESSPGRGSTFTVYLPATGLAEQSLPAATGTIYGHGRVLIMDHEPIVRTVLQRMLVRLGYEVQCTAEGSEAVAAYRQSLQEGRAFDAVILDLTVPGRMGGLEAMGRLREIDPNVKAIVSSGYSNDPVMAEYRQHGFAGVMSKPYRIEDLSLTLSRVLRP